MLFDLEDYRAWGIIGPDNKPANQINWVNPHTTSRATRDAYLKAVNEYFLSAQVLCTPEEAQTLNVKQLELLESNLVFCHQKKLERVPLLKSRAETLI